MARWRWQRSEAAHYDEACVRVSFLSSLSPPVASLQVAMQGLAAASKGASPKPSKAAPPEQPRGNGAVQLVRAVGGIHCEETGGHSTVYSRRLSHSWADGGMHRMRLVRGPDEAGGVVDDQAVAASPSPAPHIAHALRAGAILAMVRLRQLLVVLHTQRDRVPRSVADGRQARAQLAAIRLR